MIRILALVLIASTARAQSAADEPGYVLVLASTAAPALLFDALMAKNLFDDGTVRKGFAINGIAFGAVAMTMGALLALTFWGDTRVKPIWTPLAVGLAVVGVGTAVMGIWGLVHVRKEAPREPAPLPVDGEEVPWTPTPPPLPNESPQMRLTPLFGVSRTGAVLFGLGGTL